MSDDNLFGRVGEDEYMQDDPEEVVERFFDCGVDRDYRQPFVVEEWTAVAIRDVVRDDHVLTAFVERLAEYELEEHLDEHGEIWDKLMLAAERPDVRAVFTTLLDMLFERVNWRTARTKVATWNVTWALRYPDNPYDDEIDMDSVKYVRVPS